MSEDPGESAVIALMLAAAGPARVSAGYAPRLGAGDDAAILRSGEVVTTDVMVEGIHFDDRLSPADIGYKLVAVNASDIGAMGCRPTWALLTLSLPRPLDMGWVEGFSRGLTEGLARWRIRLIGGDTTGSPGPRMLGLTLAGRGRPVLRSGAKPGDRVWVSGALGESAAGFLGVDGGAPPASGLAWLRRPVPPVALGVSLSAVATAMMDLSDGLAMDLPRLCAASGVGARIDPERLPRGPSLQNASDPVPLQVAFGEDYQLLFTAPPGRDRAVRARAAACRVQVSPIGEICADPDVVLIGRPWPAQAWSHFEARP